MKKGQQSSAKLTKWGDSLLNKLPGISRTRRKRDASKKRRVNDKRAIADGAES